MRHRKSLLLFLALPLIVLLCTKAFGQGVWNNDNFLDTTFWDASPSTGDIIAALYGDGSGGVDTTAYTQTRSSISCETGNMSVEYITPGEDTLPENLSDNTIYVLEAGDYTTTTERTLGTCTAILGKGTVNITANFTTDNALISSSSKINIIVDNLILDRNDYTYLGHTHTDVIRISYTPSVTIHSTQTHNGRNGILFDHSNYGTVVNANSYHNSASMDYSSNLAAGIGFKYSHYGKVINSQTSYNNDAQTTVGIGFYNSNYGTVHDSHSTRNGGPAIWFYYSDYATIDGNNASKGSNSFDTCSQDQTNNIGITLRNSRYASIHNNTTDRLCISNSNYTMFNNNYSNSLSVTYSHNSEISNSIVSNGYGIVISDSSHVIVNNTQSFNNATSYSDYDYTMGISFFNSPYGIVNNSQSHNNYGGIIFSYDSQYGVIHNSQSYNNTTEGIKIDNSSYGTLIHNVQSYNNGTVGINFGNDGYQNTKYYGQNKVFGNVTNLSMVSSPITGSDGLLGWDNGVLDTSPTMSRDYVTNPLNVSGTYLLSRSQTFTGMRGQKVSVVFTGGAQYSFGSGILLQQPPVFYSGADLMFSGTYTTGAYIGGSVLQATGDLLNNLGAYIYNQITTVVVTGIAHNPATLYNLYGNIISAVTGVSSNTSVSITLSGSMNSNIITQIYDPINNFATHFVKKFDMNTVPPTVGTGYISTGTTGYANSNYYYTGTISVRANVSDAIVGLSGATCEYSLGTGWSSATYHTTYCEVSNLNLQTNIAIRFRITNLVNNVGTGGIGIYLYDTAPPTGGSVTINNNTTYTTGGNVTLTMNCPVDTGIGGVQIAYGNTSGASNWTSCGSKSLDLSAGDGVKTVYMRAKDAWGNISSEYTDTIILDTQKPTAQIQYTIPTATYHDVVATLSGSETLVGQNTTEHTFTSNGTFLFTFFDLAGNTGSATATVNRIDKTPPTFSGAITGSGTVRELHIYFADDVTGVTAKLNGENYISGSPITGTSTYVLAIIDQAGNAIYEIFATNFAPGIVNPVIITQTTNNNGGGTRIIKDNCPNGDFSSGYYDGSCGTVHGSASTCSIENSSYTTEYNISYVWACGLGITTQPTIQQANLDSLIQRKILAKMLSQFAIKVIGKTPDTTKSCIFTDIGSQTQEMKNYIKLVCQLGLMGYHGDGVTQKDVFNPDNTLTRAEFGTTLSRLIWGTKYANGNPYYSKHLSALKEHNIMTLISTPSIQEKKGWVLLMMHRVYEYIIK
ncbi:MAG: hypothetical protein NT085_05365 [candidate division SR1 bacterium]|nr:hypothetical protein [candidate division SR1 bacterium]